MFVLCPHCQFLVAVDPVSGEPPERCPRCDGAMLPQAAAAIATDAVATSAAGDAAMPEPVSAPDIVAHPAQIEPSPLPTNDDVEADATVAEIPASPVEAPAFAGLDAPADMSPAPEHMPGSAADSAPAPVAAASSHQRTRWRMPLAITGLAVLLVLQMLLADRAQLAADARWRPVVSAVCAVLRCELPPWHEPAAFTLVDRDVRPDPHAPGVLHVSARFRNDARWPQSWPSVLLTLSDVDGRVAGARLFTPREYAATGATHKSMASGQVARIAMDVVEPAPDIVAFTFDFR